MYEDDQNRDRDVLEESYEPNIPEMLGDGHGHGAPDYRDALEAMDEHTDIIFEHQRKIDGHNRLIRRLIDSYDTQLVPNFRREYIGLMDTLIDHLDYAKSEKEDEATANLVKGAGSLGIGLGSAVVYSGPGESIIDFYASSPAIYGQSPEIAIPTLGLPVLGGYLIKKALDKRTDQKSLEKESRKFKRARRQFQERDSQENSDRQQSR